MNIAFQQAIGRYLTPFSRGERAIWISRWQPYSHLLRILGPLKKNTAIWRLVVNELNMIVIQRAM